MEHKIGIRRRRDEAIHSFSKLFYENLNHLNMMMRIKPIIRRIVLTVTGTVSFAVIVSLIISVVYSISLRDAFGLTLMAEVVLLFILAFALLTGISERRVIHQAYYNPWVPREVREQIMKQHGKDRDTGIFIFVLALILLLILFIIKP